MAGLEKKAKDISIITSPLNQAEKTLVDLALGFRIPITEGEMILAREIAEIHAKGRIVEIPHELA